MINDTKEIIDIINLEFDPPKEKKVESKNNEKSSFLDDNPFFMNVDENKFLNDFSKLYKGSINKDINDSNYKESLKEEEKNKKQFIQDFSRAIKILITKFNNLTNSNAFSEFPTLENEINIQCVLNFFSLIFNQSSQNTNSKNISESTDMTTQQLMENINNLLVLNDDNQEYADGIDDDFCINEANSENFNFDELKKK